jgi:hypothetical protein
MQDLTADARRARKLIFLQNQNRFKNICLNICRSNPERDLRNHIIIRNTVLTSFKIYLLLYLKLNLTCQNSKPTPTFDFMILFSFINNNAR